MRKAGRQTTFPSLDDVRARLDPPAKPKRFDRAKETRAANAERKRYDSWLEGLAKTAVAKVRMQRQQATTLEAAARPVSVEVRESDRAHVSLCVLRTKPGVTADPVAYVVTEAIETRLRALGSTEHVSVRFSDGPSMRLMVGIGVEAAAMGGVKAAIAPVRANARQAKVPVARAVQDLLSSNTDFAGINGFGAKHALAINTAIRAVLGSLTTVQCEQLFEMSKHDIYAFASGKQPLSHIAALMFVRKAVRQLLENPTLEIPPEVSEQDLRKALADLRP